MKKKYELTEEHKAQLPAWCDKFIANTMSTKPMDVAEKAIVREEVKKLYLAANLTPPPDNRIVFVPSPFVLRFAGGFAAAIWYLKNNKLATSAATWAATSAATSAATRAATSAATEDATRAATWAATSAATRAATSAATSAATRAATSDATETATRAATSDATSAKLTTKNDSWFNFPIHEMRRLSDALSLGELGIQCAACTSSMWHGGNQWSSWAGLLSFFRYIAKLDLDYSKYDSYEKLALHSGPRIMHKEFCMISDRPEVLLVDTQNRPHCETGPFCKWRDGSGLYSLHGVRVPVWAIETPKEDINPKDILALENTEQRMALMKHVGIYKFLKELKAQEIHSFKGYKLYTIEVEGQRIGPYLYMQCPSTGREFLEGVGDSELHERIDTSIKTCEDALKWRTMKASKNLMTKFNLNWQYSA